jgi:hypothetical protein
VRRRDALETSLELELFGELLELLADYGAARQPKRKAFAYRRVECKKPEPLAEPAVVAGIDA